MNKRTRIISLFMIFILLISGINLSLTEASNNSMLGASIDSCKTDSHSLSPVQIISHIDMCTSELLDGNPSTFIFNIGIKTKANNSRNSSTTALLLLFAVLFTIGIKSFSSLSHESNSTSFILVFIHNKDGKK